MQTVYIDVYFLINFTVDLLAFHLAAAFSKIPIKNPRLFISAALSALYACVILFVSVSGWVIIFISLATVIALSYALVCGISIIRRTKLIASFILLLTIIGGIAHWVFGFLDNYFPTQAGTVVQNRKLLILSVLVLLSVGIIRLLFVLFFHSATERSIRVKIELNGRAVECDALVDSGNLLKDPIDLTPVMLVKAGVAQKLFPQGLPALSVGELSEDVAPFVRLIPINKGGRKTVALGIRPKRVSVLHNKKYVEARLLFIIDEEEGRYGGYDVLLPSSALECI